MSQSFSNASSSSDADSRLHPMSKGEFVALIAMMFATIAFSIDAMLPALPEIGQELSPDNVNRAQLIITSFVLGMGVGTFFTGPLSDALGRKPVILGGASIYILAAGLAWASESLELALFARLMMGLGAAGPRVVAIAIIRDLFSGREMARVVSIAMMIFTLVPAVAPLLGTGVMYLFSWRVIFLAFAAFAFVIALWVTTRLPETLPPVSRRPMRLPLMGTALAEMATHPTVRLSILAQCLSLGMLFTMVTLVQPAYDVVFDRADSFPYWFFGVALLAGTGSLMNAVLVVRVGMRRIVTLALGIQILLSSGMLLLDLLPLENSVAFGFFVAWQTSVFFMAGVTLGNLNAIAMEPMGHIAGIAASVMSAIATVAAAAIAAPVGLLFDGSLLPLTAGILGMSSTGFVIMLYMARVEERQPL